MALAIVSGMLITVETTTGLLSPTRGFLGTLVSPLRQIANAPYTISESVSSTVSSRSSLEVRNAELVEQNLKLSEATQRLLALQAENDRLRELLGSQARVPHEVLVAEMVGVVPSPNTHQIIIDKGAMHGLSIGQAVVDASGVFGQVVEVSRSTSRVLKVTDTTHAIPVQINRSGLRSIAAGSGEFDKLGLENLPVTADVKEGDLVVTSGLGGRFPIGYPVGRIESVIVEPTHPFALVSIRPSALLNRSRHVLVVLAVQAEPDLSVEDPQEAQDSQTPANDDDSIAAPEAST